MRSQDLDIGGLFGSIRDAVIAAAANIGRIVLWIPAATKIFGYLFSERLGDEHLRAQQCAGVALSRSNWPRFLYRLRRLAGAARPAQAGEEIVK
ncbi:MAG: hypothetical protein M3272_08755 [Actinomycetota bacterium]|nr:hypothetical protein [Actinomycetota bacterium]